MNYRALPIGISDFAEMIKKEYYYADKTLMIRDLLQIKSKVTLFTRPRRFGKTLNMSMIRALNLVLKNSFSISMKSAAKRTINLGRQGQTGKQAGLVVSI